MKSDVQGFDIGFSSAAVIGCGCLGCNIGVHLAGAGIGKLAFCDFDTVSVSNLNRQFLYTHGDVGKPKADVMKERLEAFAPDCEILALDRKIESASDLEFARSFDIVILAVDNASARKTVSDFCVANALPLVVGGINGSYGMAYLYIPGKSPSPEATGMCEAESGKILHVSPAAGIIGSLQSSLAIRYLTGDGEAFAGRLFIYDNEEIKSLKIKG